ncbi:MAG TPA: DUF308 domain-containing protein [Ignavibacteria bacterium]|nr:DUF308 domain-containing protein [Ignavibacteria bacterium]
MFKKWWVLLIQGILMFILGLYIFSNPVEVLAGMSLWFGLLIIFTGLAGIFGWIFGGKEGRETHSLIWSLISVLFGLFVLMNLLAAMKAITIIFGIWVIALGFSLISSGWEIKKAGFMGWIILIIGILSLFAGLSMIFNIGSGAGGVSTILGISVLLSGIALIIMSFAKKAIVGKIKDKVNSLK